MATTPSTVAEPVSRHSALSTGFLARHRYSSRLRAVAYPGTAVFIAVFLAVVMVTHRSPADSTDPLGGATSREPAPSAAGEPDANTCAALVAEMPLPDRLAQRLMIGVDPGAPAAARALERDTHVGGLFIGGNATQILQGSALTVIQSAALYPIAVAVDDEGGRVQRIDTLHGSMPSARQMGTMPPGEVRRIGAQRGRELKARGVTVDFAPVLDLGAHPGNAVIGDRAFSADPAVVVAHAGAFAAGLRDAGITPVFKHFPGHGRANGDSHRKLVTTPPLASLRVMDLPPYEQLLTEGPSVVMVGHLNVPGLTNGVPATLSPPAYRLLRDEIGFTGVTITDDLGGMRAVSDRYGIVDAVTTALESGADIALWTSAEKLDDVLARLMTETEANRLPVADTDASVARILEMKGVCRG